ncbi:MAG: hypothetical protein AAF216_10430 [Pseudomonadota bacterium]
MRLAKTPQFTPQPFTIVGWEVDDITGDVADLASKGITFLQFDGLRQDQRGIWTVPDGTQICWFADPDGIVLPLSQTG